MRKLARLAVLGSFLASGGACFAQSWPPWAEELFGYRRWDYDRRWEPDRRWREPERPPRPDYQRKPPPEGGDIRSGGARPEIAPVAPPIVDFPHAYPANSIVIDIGGRKLYYVLADKRAYAYPISVGREGFNWTGTETVSRKQPWPDWYPPVEMRERDPSLPEKMTGGVKNPLGAVALYLGNTLYRIHGTNDAKSIGRAASSGCFRMLNSAAVHLASITEIGTSVTVVSSLPSPQQVSRAPEPSPTAPAANQAPPPPPATSQTSSSPVANQAPPPAKQPAQPPSEPAPPAPQASAQPVPAPAPEQARRRETVPNYEALRDYTLGAR
jgi:lipoprotein-anchoring transpeptidase ErfK/SrfK